jgi:hypothetical protein
LGELELEVQVNRALRLLLLGFTHDAMVATGSSTGNAPAHRSPTNLDSRMVGEASIIILEEAVQPYA